MRPIALLTAMTAVTLTLASPGAVEARPWYENQYVWGATGIVLGGVVGYELGRSAENRRQNRGNNVVIVPTQQAPVFIPGGPMVTGNFVDETRVWPFYRRTRVFPIASTAPINYTPLSYSVPGPTLSVLDFPASNPSGGMLAVDPGQAGQQNPPQEITINIGDNNQGVNINIAGNEHRRDGESRTSIRPVENMRSDHPLAESNRGRVVDMQIPDPSPAAAEPRSEALVAAEAE